MPSYRPLLIADIPWLLYRSFFALPRSIVGADGEPVNALLGTVNALLGVIEQRSGTECPRAVVACFGAEQADYRVKLYAPYHAHRDPMPAALAHQWKQAPTLLASFGWIVYDAAALEADDAMFSFARVEQAAGGRALLMTGDRDLYGAVGERVMVLELLKGGVSAELGASQVRERVGVDPAQIPDLIALRGDPSDGLPGAPGVGAKTAAELLRAYGTLERALSAARELESHVARSDEMRPRTAAALREHEQRLLDFKQIATLQPIAVPHPADSATDFASGATCARQLGMRQLADRLERLATG
jgi:5'-3' exonuclease